MFDYLTFRGGKPDPSEQRKSSLFYMGVPQEKMKQLQIKTVNGRPNRHRNFLTRQYVSSLMKFVIFYHVISNRQRKYCSRKEQTGILTKFPPWSEPRRFGPRQALEGWCCPGGECPGWSQLCNVSVQLENQTCPVNQKTPLFIERFSIWFAKPKPKTKAITLAYQYKRK